MSWTAQQYPMYVQQPSAPQGWPAGVWPPSAPTAPPPVPTGVNINPQHWSNGQWVYNSMYRGPMPNSQASVPNSQAAAQMWAAHPSWGAQVAQAAANQAAQHNPYKRVPNRGDAEYWNTKLSDNPLGLENMIKDEVPPEKVKDSPNGVPHTPWVWVPKELGKQDGGEPAHQRNGRPGAPPAPPAPSVPSVPPTSQAPVIPPPLSQPAAPTRQQPTHERPPRSQPHESLSRSNTLTRSNGLSRAHTIDSHARSHAREATRSPSRDPRSHHRSPSYEPRQHPDSRQHTRSPPPPSGTPRWPYASHGRGSATPASGSSPERPREDHRERARERSSIYQRDVSQEASRERSSAYIRDDRKESTSNRTSHYPTDDRRERTRERERTMSTRSSPNAEPNLDSAPAAPVIPPPPERLPPGSQASYAAYQQAQQQKQQQQQRQHHRAQSREVSPRPADTSRETRPPYAAHASAASSASAVAARAASKPKEEPFSSKGELLPTFPHSIVRTPDHYSSASPTPRRSSEETDRAPSRPSHGPIYGPPTPSRTDSTPSRQHPGTSSASAAAAAATSAKPATAIMTSLAGFSDEPPGLLSPLIGIPAPKTPTRLSPSGREVSRSQTYPVVGSSFQPIPEDRTTSQPRTPRPREHESASDGDRDRERRREASTTPKHPRSPTYRSPDNSARMITRSYTYPTLESSPQPSPSHHHSRSGSRSRPPSPHRQSRHAAAAAAVNPLPAPPKPMPYPYTPPSLNPSPTQPQHSPSRVPPVTSPRSSNHHRPAVQRRIGFWNRRGDHLLFENGRYWIVYAPRSRANAAELAQYPNPLEGFMDHTGHKVKYDNTVPELPDSLPLHGEPPRRPYDHFVQYTTVYI